MKHSMGGRHVSICPFLSNRFLSNSKITGEIGQKWTIGQKLNFYIIILMHNYYSAAALVNIKQEWVNSLYTLQTCRKNFEYILLFL